MKLSLSRISRIISEEMSLFLREGDVEIEDASGDGGGSVKSQKKKGANRGDREKMDMDDAVDSDGDGGKDPSGAVNNEVTGKTIQSISVSPDSGVLPGAKEIILTFNESTDPLKILVTQTGTVKFFWRNQLHDMP